MSGLAILGGSPSRDTKINPWPKWPVWDEKEEKALLEVLNTEHCEQGMYTRQMEHYVDCIRSGKQPVSGLPEGQIILNIVDAAYLSSKTGEVVNL